MHEFTTTGDIFTLEERGKIHYVDNPEEGKRSDVSARYANQDILLDGVVRRCKGVEMHCVPIIRKGAPIGLLIENVEA